MNPNRAATARERTRRGAFPPRKRYRKPVTEFISEPITPSAGTFDVSRMGRGEPGLPEGFTWREESASIVEVVETWKQSSREGGVGELYLRRHYYKLRMSDGSVWTVYFVRQAPRSGNRKARWFLYSLENKKR